MCQAEIKRLPVQKTNERTLLKNTESLNETKKMSFDVNQKYRYPVYVGQRCVLNQALKRTGRESIRPAVFNYHA